MTHFSVRRAHDESYCVIFLKSILSFFALSFTWKSILKSCVIYVYILTAQEEEETENVAFFRLFWSRSFGLLESWNAPADRSSEILILQEKREDVRGDLRRGDRWLRPERHRGRGVLEEAVPWA